MVRFDPHGAQLKKDEFDEIGEDFAFYCGVFEDFEGHFGSGV